MSGVSTGTLEESLVENELAYKNNFPADQPIVHCFANHNKASYKQGYNSDGDLPFFDPIAAKNEDPDTYVEEATERTFPVSAPADAVELPVMQEAPVLTVQAANCMRVSEIKIELWKHGQRVMGNKTELLGRLIEAIQNNAPVLDVAE
eukprot:9916160-Ditylum_brightwellii.AAC.1